ncbi:hypothetical protein TNCV_1028941 [Trichonephila clavipes]|nr:hypothetical protein TNCV_1028941 [Trichonephila clavipes]
MSWRIGERTIQLWRACELLLLRQVCFDGLSVMSCGFRGLSVASCDLTAYYAVSCVSDGILVALAVDRWRHVVLHCFKVQPGSPMKEIKTGYLPIPQPTPLEEELSDVLKEIRSDETTTIRTVRSSTLATDFRWPQKKKSQGLRSGKRGCQPTGTPRLIHLPRYAAWWWLCTEIEKGAGAPSCMHYAF